ncbi:MAG: glycosyltransferase family 4 protein [Thermodesulfobacteriota bacterium]
MERIAIRPADAREGTNGKPLKVCLLTYRGNPTCGGQGIYIKRISRALKDLGHQVDVVSGPPYPHLDGDVRLHQLDGLDLYNPEALFRIPTIKELRSSINVLEWMGVSTGGFPEPLTFGLRAYRFLKDRVGEFDVIHDNQCLAYGLLKIQQLGFPLVATIHHPIMVDREAELQSVKWWWKRLKIRRWYSFVGMQTRVSRDLSHLITVSERSRQDVARAFTIPTQRLSVVPNGIDTGTFRPLPDVKREENRIITTTSSDVPIKGLRYLLEAVASIAKHRDIRVTVIGRPRKDKGVEDLVRDLALGRFVEFTGRIEDEEFAQYYARATLAVVPSLYEGFGFPAGEAMACKTPVVSTTGGALPEVVGDAGVLVPPADSQALAGAIVSLLDDPGRRHQLGEAGYRRVHEHFTWKRAAERMVEVYREAMHANGRFLEN